MTNHILKHENKSILNILAHIQQLQELNSIMARYLPPDVANHCKVVKLDRDCLIVLTENGNWATQLRFQIPELLQQLRQHPLLAKLSGICCKTRPSHYPSALNRIPTHSVAPLSQKASSFLLETAKTIGDERLRKIMEKIGNRT